ncbi:hypothetical protein [Paenibacillus sp. MBLB4367]|uniref:hypothetical protein n=1 Tax=Paenibacillus sp. MBLB4367 TaxID=3384767 RepID=UPI00390818EA
MHDHPSKRLSKSYGTSSRMQPDKHVQQQGNEPPLQRALAYGQALTSAHILQLQRSVGNAAAAQLVRSRQPSAPPDGDEGGAVQRKGIASHEDLPVQRAESEEEREGGEAEEETVSLSPEEADMFESVMNELSDEELEKGLESELEDEQKLDGEAAVQAKPDPSGATIQMVKLVSSISSEKNPNLALAGRLEKNNSRKPRLVPVTRWRRIKAKYKQRGYRKYAAIFHQNLQNDAGTADLVLLLRVNRRIKAGARLDKHYASIEKKSSQKRQTAQTRTELLGEAVTSIRMENYAGGDCKMLIGYASGPGIDQLWVSHSKKTYYVVEAKGPGAKLKVDRFATRGAKKGGGTLKQMSQAWIEDRVPRLKTSYPNELQQLLDDCSLKVHNGRLVDDPNGNGAYKLEGIVITANWKEAQGDIGSSFSKETYTF